MNLGYTVRENSVSFFVYIRHKSKNPSHASPFAIRTLIVTLPYSLPTVIEKRCQKQNKG